MDHNDLEEKTWPFGLMKREPLNFHKDDEIVLKRDDSNGWVQGRLVKLAMTQEWTGASNEKQSAGWIPNHWLKKKQMEGVAYNGMATETLERSGMFPRFKVKPKLIKGQFKAFEQEVPI